MLSEAGSKAYETLKNNEYFPKQSFEAYVTKKLNKGKRTLFLNRDVNETVRALKSEYRTILIQN